MEAVCREITILLWRNCIGAWLVVVLAAAPARPAPGIWPCGWLEREPPLELQRDRLEARLLELIAVHRKAPLSRLRDLSSAQKLASQRALVRSFGSELSRLFNLMACDDDRPAGWLSRAPVAGGIELGLAHRIRLASPLLQE